MKREIDSTLKDWKKTEERKVLLVRGARQVGKTYSVRQLGCEFEHFLEVNFEEEPRVREFFEESLNPEGINEKLAAYFGVPIVPRKTLLFLDEIQGCPNALRSLRFYHEKLPGLHVVAAGSLLEFALGEIPSSGVGRISNLFMYPMTFAEFLWAKNENLLIEALANAGPDRPLDNTLHERLLERFRIYELLGGLPEVIKAYIAGKDPASCQTIIDELITTLEDDFSKYKTRILPTVLKEALRSVCHQAGGKFVYSKMSCSGFSRQYRESLELLVKAGLAYRVYHTSARGIPLGAQLNPKKFKAILFDIGVHQRLSGLNIAEHIINEPAELINRGNLAEMFAGLEIAAHSSPHLRPQLYYWHRESRASNAEVDYVIQLGGKIIPVEVKAGTRGQMQSMFVFLQERGLSIGIRVSQENFGSYHKILTVPIYAVGNIIEGRIQI